MSPFSTRTSGVTPPGVGVELGAFCVDNGIYQEIPGVPRNFRVPISWLSETPFQLETAMSAARVVEVTSMPFEMSRGGMTDFYNNSITTKVIMERGYAIPGIPHFLRPWDPPVSPIRLRTEIDVRMPADSHLSEDDLCEIGRLVDNTIHRQLDHSMLGVPVTPATPYVFGSLLYQAVAEHTQNQSDIPDFPRVSVIRVDQGYTGLVGEFKLSAYIDEASFAQIREGSLASRERHIVSQIRQKMKNAVILVKKGKSLVRKPLTAEEKVAQQERKARETLREMLSESEYRRYLTNGFVMVKAQSGTWYQIFGSRETTLKTYKDGKPFESLCIHTDPECPPTDHVINMKVLLEIDEQAVRSSANIRPIANTPTATEQMYRAIGAVVNRQLGIPEGEEKLVDLYKRLKKTA